MTTLRLLAICSIIALITATSTSDEEVHATAILRDGEYMVEIGSKHSFTGLNSAATASWIDGLFKTGWGELTIDTSPNHSDRDQYFAAGVLEGRLTAKHIYNQATNLAGITFAKTNGTAPANVVSFMKAHDTWMRSEAASKNSTSAFWRQASGIIAQFDGLMAGYHMASMLGEVPPLDFFAFQLLNALGDLFQIIPAVQASERMNWSKMSSAQVRAERVRRGHCSAIIKVTGDFSDLLFGHSSWFDFGATNRIFKHYRLALHDPSTAAQKTSFSSYAGFLYSLDDFYMMDSGLGMTQTSNDIMNDELLKLIKPESLMAWQRVRIANVMASTGKEWHDVFATAASGTYANQYMIVDMKRFTPYAAPLKGGTLYVVEEIPGLVAGKVSNSNPNSA